MRHSKQQHCVVRNMMALRKTSMRLRVRAMTGELHALLLPLLLAAAPV